MQTSKFPEDSNAPQADDSEFINMDWYVNAWIHSFKGNKLHIGDLRPEDLDIEEIAHALSNTCRFGGHCSNFYSVAEHCLIMSNIVSPELALSALLHDAAEYILTDVPKPFKRLMPEFTKYENGIMESVDKRYNVNTNHPDIKIMDKRMVISEANLLLHDPEWAREWPYPVIPNFDKVLQCYSPRTVESLFLHRFKTLVGSDE